MVGDRGPRCPASQHALCCVSVWLCVDQVSQAADAEARAALVTYAVLVEERLRHCQADTAASGWVSRDHAQQQCDVACSRVFEPDVGFSVKQGLAVLKRHGLVEQAVRDDVILVRAVTTTEAVNTVRRQWKTMFPRLSDVAK